MVTKQVRRAPEDKDVTRADSLAREIFSGVANKWALLIINVLGEQTLRFTEVRTAVDGISHKMLTQTLRGLERDGLVHRTVYAEVPPRVDYRLTEAGGALRDTVNGMCAWTRRYLDEIEAARRRFDAQHNDAAHPRTPAPRTERG
ncbi:HxlR family transcriptional regulator [Streptomyces avermitilis]|uniref:HxlR family transcriptional regulator n=1 Tax=Streptomyces avermitilis TaxID=33903 RepID=A0A4D4N6Y7_STRAX|nr:HxlR family transcriptional regulator [Streptomyces avermitilis]GDY79299.1 HxlR family transcriptional regulator [Streptomyces avermitilis]